jgi:hypothetical protein
MRIDDATRNQIASLLLPQTVESATAKIWGELSGTITQRIARPELNDSGSCDPIEVAPFLHECRLVVEKHLRKMANVYPSLQWLWYLRRLPRFVFAGRLGTTFTYDVTLAEVISGQGGLDTRRTPLSSGFVRYEINHVDIQNVLQFCAGVRLLSQIHVLLRLAGKGCFFRFNEREALPKDIRTPEQYQAIQLYDKRVDTFGHPFSHTGTVITSDTLDPLREDTILCVFRLAEPSWMPSLIRSTSGELVQVSVFSEFVPRLTSLNDLIHLNTDPRLRETRWLDSEIGAILLLLKMAFRMAMIAESGFVTIQQRGYIMAGEEGFSRIVSEHFDDASLTLGNVLPDILLPRAVNELLRILKRRSGETWPLISGPVIRRAGDNLCIDLQTATSRLERLLEFPALTGEVANARAKHFEKAVQSTIDLTPWRPDKHIQDLRGVTLRHDGKPLTDIDAIGEQNGVLLMVSCKSLIDSGKYDVGDYQVVRNAATTVEQAVARWKGIKEFLETNRKGDNYDFSGYKELIAVVCTPSPIYTSIETAAITAAPNLHAASSIDELREWLRESDVAKGSV